MGLARWYALLHPHLHEERLRARVLRAGGELHLAVLETPKVMSTVQDENGFVLSSSEVVPSNPKTCFRFAFT